MFKTEDAQVTGGLYIFVVYPPNLGAYPNRFLFLFVALLNNYLFCA